MKFHRSDCLRTSSVSPIGQTLAMPDVRRYGKYREYIGHGTNSTDQKSGLFATGIL